MLAVEAALGSRYTRQALSAHPAVKHAFQQRKAGAAARPGERPRSARARAIAAERARMRAELVELKRREELLLERLAQVELQRARQRHPDLPCLRRTSEEAAPRRQERRRSPGRRGRASD